MTIEAVRKLPRTEKLRLMETLWEELSRPATEFDSPAWHGKELAETERRLAAGKEQILDWEIAKKKLRISSSRREENPSFKKKRYEANELCSRRLHNVGQASCLSPSLFSALGDSKNADSQRCIKGSSETIQKTVHWQVLKFSAS